MNRIVTMLVLAGIVMFSLAAPVSAENASVTYRNAKVIGMGDARVAGGFGYNGFIYNPALLSRVQNFRLALVSLPITFNKDTLDMGEFISDNQDKFEKFDELTAEEKVEFLDEVQKYGNKWSRMNVSPMINMSFNVLGHGLGLALYNTTDANIRMDRGIYEPRVWGEGKSAMVAALGYARPLSMFVPGLTVGANLKFIQRRHANLFQIKASDLGDMRETMEPINDEIKNEKHNTMAMDLGMLMEIPMIDAEVGATMQSIGDGRGASLDVGISKRFLDDNLLVLADYIDTLDNNKENIFNKLHVGTQYSLQMLKLRAGLNSGYPTVGFGINFRIIDLDAAYFLDEMGNAPGMEEDTRYIVQLKLGW